MASVEQGNAYRVERWGPRHTLNPLQRQVRSLYDELSRKLGAPTEQLMDATLAWNFCPFRSPSWDDWQAGRNRWPSQAARRLAARDRAA